MAELGVNIDHVATVRQARRTYEPDPVWAACLAELGGADGITLHLREDRRHIQERDLRLLRETVTVKLNLEMACDSGVLAIAREVRPDQVTLVPEKREEITTEGGLDVAGQKARVREVMAALGDAGIALSLFSIPILVRSRSPRSLGPTPSSCTPANTPTPGRAVSNSPNWRPSAGPACKSAKPAWLSTPATV